MVYICKNLMKYRVSSLEVMIVSQIQQAVSIDYILEPSKGFHSIVRSDIFSRIKKRYIHSWVYVLLMSRLHKGTVSDHGWIYKFPEAVHFILCLHIVDTLCARVSSLDVRPRVKPAIKKVKF